MQRYLLPHRAWFERCSPCSSVCRRALSNQSGWQSVRLTDAELDDLEAPQARQLDDEGLVVMGQSRTWGEALRMSREQRRQRFVRIGKKDGKVFLNKAPQNIGFLPSFYRRWPAEEYALSLQDLVELNASWQRFQKGIRFPFVPWLVRPFHSVFAQPNHFQHYRLLNDWLETRYPHASRASLPLRALDLGVGSGVITLQLLAGFPQGSVLAADLHSNALIGLRVQLDQLPQPVRTRVRSCKSDLFDSIDAGPFDLIVCNPPWLPGHSHTPSDAGNYHPPDFFVRLVSAARPFVVPETGRLLLMYSTHARHLVDQRQPYVHPIEAAVHACPGARVESFAQRDWDPVAKLDDPASSSLQVELWVISF